MQKVQAELIYLEKWMGEYKIPSTGEKAEDVYVVKYRYILRSKYYTRKFISIGFPKRHIILQREGSGRFQPSRSETNLTKFKDPVRTGVLIAIAFLVLLAVYLLLPQIVKLLRTIWEAEIFNTL